MRRWSKLESSDNDVSNYKENRGNCEVNRGSDIVTEEDSEDIHSQVIIVQSITLLILQVRLKAQNIFPP